MLTSKQRSYLRGLANTLDAIFQVGKSGTTPEITSAVGVSLDARELVKITVLSNCMEDPRSVADLISERTHSEVVQVIGRKITLYKPSKDKPVIELPE